MKKITLTKEVIKNLKKEGYIDDQFIASAQTYIKAVKDGRALFTVNSVSRSGMSRNITVQSCEKSKAGGYYYRHYALMFRALGERVNDDLSIKVSGAGMSMTFALNYNTMRALMNMGFMSETQFETLSQKIR